MKRWRGIKARAPHHNFISPRWSRVCRLITPCDISDAFCLPMIKDGSRSRCFFFCLYSICICYLCFGCDNRLPYFTQEKTIPHKIAQVQNHLGIEKQVFFFLGDGCCLVFLFFVSVRRKKETSTESEFGFVLFCSFYPHVSCFIFQLPVFVCLHFLSSPVFQLSMSPCVFDSVFFLDFPWPALLDFGLIARFLFFYLPASVCKVNCKCNQ